MRDGHDDEREMTPGVIAPPPLLFAFVLLAGLGLEVVVPTGALAALAGWLRGLLAVAALGSAGYLGVAGIRAFGSAGTPVEPWHPSRALVTGRVFARVRNPMYQGLVLILLGLAVAWPSDWLLLAAAVLAPILHYGVVRREEAYLLARFGEPYQRYLATVPRWGWRL